MINWIDLNSQSQLRDIIRESYSQRVFIFKHSTRCNISSIAKLRLEDHWDPSFSNNSQVYFLDVIAQRALSQELASQFDVYHESPQILLIEDGECIHDASHFDISVEEIREVL